MPAVQQQGKGAGSGAAAGRSEATGGAAAAAPVRDATRYLDPDEVKNPQAEADYLLSRGWKFCVSWESPNPKARWLDPLSGKQDLRKQVADEQRDAAGRVEKDAVVQVQAGIPAWYYSRAQALEIQHARDEAKKKEKK